VSARDEGRFGKELDANLTGSCTSGARRGAYGAECIDNMTILNRTNASTRPLRRFECDKMMLLLLLI